MRPEIEKLTRALRRENSPVAHQGMVQSAIDAGVPLDELRDALDYAEMQRSYQRSSNPWLPRLGLLAFLKGKRWSLRRELPS